MCIQLCNSDSGTKVREEGERNWGECGMGNVKLILGILLTEILFLLYLFFFV